jgi:hypothetical protein
MTTDLSQVLDQLQGNPKLASQFMENPRQTLVSQGVNVSGLEIGAPERVVATPTRPVGRAITVCVTVGCIVCASVGGDIGDDDVAEVGKTLEKEA